MIEQSTLDFLAQLKHNNERAWFNDHKDEYKAALANFTDLVAILLHNNSGFDERLVGVQPKECLFRIYRDVRFSKDKSLSEAEMCQLLGKHGFSIASLSYRLDGDGTVFE